MIYKFKRAAPAVPGLPSTDSVGMTPANALAPRLPDIIMRGPLGDFQAGNVLSDFLNYSKTFSWADTLSWSHGRQTTRTGVFALIQPLESSNISLARGRLAFQNFTDFLLGMDAAHNGSPQRLSNVRSIEADEGTCPAGNVILLLPYNHVAAFVEHAIKVTRRLTLNFGLRWEYLPSSFRRAHDLGNVWPSLLHTGPIPPVSRPHS